MRISISLFRTFGKVDEVAASFLIRRWWETLYALVTQGPHKNFLTGSSIIRSFLCPVFIFAIVLAYYNLVVLGIFLLGNNFCILPGYLLFMKYRRELDIRRFCTNSRRAEITMQMTAMRNKS